MDERQNVADSLYCQDPRHATLGHHYYWYYGGRSGYVPYGTHISGGSATVPSQGFNSSPSGTSRGVIGGAGEAAGSHASGGGEGAGE